MLLTAMTKLALSTPSDLQYNKPGSVGHASGNAIFHILCVAIFAQPNNNNKCLTPNILHLC